MFDVIFIQTMDLINKGIKGKMVELIEIYLEVGIYPHSKVLGYILKYSTI